MIYTTGYLLYSLKSFADAVKAVDATVVDIRMSPFSRAPQWQGYNLAKSLPKYIHIKEFGNAAYKTGGIRIADFEAGLKRLEKIDGNVVLMCACKYASECHRTTLADMLRSIGYSVKELEPGDYARAPLAEIQARMF